MRLLVWWSDPRNARQPPAHPISIGALAGQDGIELAELDPADGRLDLGETPVVAEHNVFVSSPLPMVTQQPKPFCGVRVVGQHYPALAHRDVFGGSEAEHRGPAERADWRPAEIGSCRLRGVLQDQEAVIVACRHDPVEIPWLAGIVHNDDSLGLAGGKPGY